MSNKIIYILLILISASFPGFTQTINEHISNKTIYGFLDELANDKIIILNSTIKPYAQTYILLKLKEAEKQEEALTLRQQNDLNFYLGIYGFNDDIKYNPYSETAKVNIFNKQSSSVTSINPLGFFYKDSLFTFSLKPIWGINYQTNEAGSVRHTWGGAEAYGTIGKHWGVYANLRDNYITEILAFPSYFTQSEGGNYKLNEGGRKGGDYSEMRGGVFYSWKWGSVSVAKDHLVWGDNYNGANIFSGITPSFAMIKLNMHPARWLDFNYFHGWLVSEVIDSSRSYTTGNGDFRAVYRDKYIAANMFTFSPWEGLNFSIGNSIIYSDINIQPAYFIPFLFFKSVDHTINHNIDNQNSQMFANISCRLIKYFHFYSSLFIDEFSITRIGVDTLHNFTSWKVGGKLSNWPFKNISLTAEYTKTNPLVYKHRVPSLTFETNKFNLGHYLRDNSEEIFLSVQYKPFSRFNLEFSYLKATHGNEYQYISESRADNPVLDEITWDNERFSLKSRYEFIFEGYLFLEYTHSNIQGYNIDGISSQYYLDLFTPKFYQGKKNTFTFGFNIGF